MTIPACAARRDLDPERNRHVCLHPRVYAPGLEVTSAICRRCEYAGSAPTELRPFPTHGAGLALATAGRPPQRGAICFHLGSFVGDEECQTCTGRVRVKHYRCTHPRHDETTIAACRDCPDHEPALTRNAGPLAWAVGIVTAPRATPTLARTVLSLQAAGWDRPWLFAEPGTELPPEATQLPLAQRGERLGLWPNWFLALSELSLRFPGADAFLLCEDDIVVRPQLRPCLDRTLWPSPRLAALSLFCPSGYGRQSTGWFPVDEGWGLAGAQAFVFPGAAVRKLLSDTLAVHHRRRGPRRGLYDTDAVVGLWAQLAGLPILHHRPSLAQHIGDASTVGHGRAEGAYRSADDFHETLPQSEPINATIFPILPS